MLDLERPLTAKVMGMDAELTIQQVSERIGLSVYTLRYYERNGLLQPIIGLQMGIVAIQLPT